jgi:hypothetical protein
VSEAEGGGDDVSGMIAGIRSPDVALPPAGIRPDGLAGCAQTGAESASAAITATPLKRCFVFICSLR